MYRLFKQNIIRYELNQRFGSVFVEKRDTETTALQQQIRFTLTSPEVTNNSRSA